MIVTNEDEHLRMFVEYVKRLNKANHRCGHAYLATGMYGETAIERAMELFHDKVKLTKRNHLQTVLRQIYIDLMPWTVD